MDFIKADSVDQSIMFHLNTGDLTITGFKIGYVRWNQGDGTSFTKSTPQTLNKLVSGSPAYQSVHADNYGIYIEETETSQGDYFLFRADFPDAAFAVGAEQVICHLYDDGNNVIAQRIFRLTYPSVDVVSMASDTITNTALAASAVTEIQSGLATEAKQDIIDTNVDAILVDTGTTLPSSLSDISGLINTAQADLDIITGADGVNLLTATQASIDAIEVDTGTTIPAILGSPVGADLSADIAGVQSTAEAVQEDTGTTIPAQITALNNISAAEVNAEMVDVLGVDTMDELPASTDLPTNPTIKEALMADYMMKSCKITQTATEQKHHNKAGTNTFRKAVSDDGTTATYGISAAGT